MCATKKGAFLYASNFSLGVNIFFALNEKLAQMMGQDVYVDTILIYSLDGRLIYSEKPNQVKKIYNLVTLPKTGILVAKFGESRYVKKFLR